jgi:ATP-binding cassette, subfamily C, bacteriocin exporter
MMKRCKPVKQQDITDCGAACLVSVAMHFKLDLSVTRIRQLANTDKQGTSMLGMIEAAEKLGFNAKGVKGSFHCLFDIPLPSIVHVETANRFHHFKVIYGIDKRVVKLMDPADGKVHRMSHENFQKEWTGVILLLVPSVDFHPGNYSQSTGRRFLSLLRPHRAIMLQSLFGAVIYALLGLATSVYMQKIVDYVLIDGNVNLLIMMSIVMIFLQFLRIFINTVKSIFALKTGLQIDAALIMGYYRHLLDLPQRFFDTMRVGEILSRIGDAVKIRTFINNVSLDLAVNLMIVIFSCVLMILFSFKMALAVLTAIPLYIIIYYVFNLINKKVLRRIMENAAELEAHMVESINTVFTMKTFSAEGFSNQKTEIRFFKLLKTIYIASKSSIIAQNATELLAGILTVGLLWIGSLLVIKNEITPGTLLSFYALMGYLIGPIAYLINANHLIQDALIAADRLFQIMDLECEKAKNGGILLTKELIGNIRFDHVDFRYGSRLQVFDDLSLIFKAGEFSAIVGESGSGKTSIIAILERLYPIQSGSIEIGNYNLHQIDIVSLRRQMGIVPQRVELISGTIAENIAFGDFEPDLKRIIDICGWLNIRDFIEKIPGAYNALLGEHGISLSGGEQQRLAIARALYHDPQILIMDEATSALDAAAEAHIRQIISRLKALGKTVIVITHRFRTIMQADHIVVLHKGRLVEEGEHHCLMAKKGYYFSLWKQQFPLLEEVRD